MGELNGPAIIASNHPNSMMDAIVIGCTCKRPVHFTIRSDMFNNPLFHLLLRYLNGIPVYRISEEKEKLRKNFDTIEQCRQILKKDGIIIIFAEGTTLHDWNLKPLKSGTAKMVQHALHDKYLRNELQVVPVGLTYSNYKHPAKTLIIQCGEVFYPGRLENGTPAGAWKQQFNAFLFRKLLPTIPVMIPAGRHAQNIWQTIVTNITIGDSRCSRIKSLHEQGRLLSDAKIDIPVYHQIKHHYLPLHSAEYRSSYFFAIFLCIPGLAGFILNSPFYFPASIWVRNKTKDSIFYDALLFGLFVILYPFYILLLSLSMQWIIPVPFWIWVPLIPFTGWCTTQLWVYCLKIINNARLHSAERKWMREVLSGVGLSNKKRQDAD
ncbi:MAG TPA: 1-acyl-sn-glycerol-3-phosphate acyltransferase [Agriterribacter sp.]|nr:1-acyl-sn-glycerol-3-phosphate acyltransferase [Agriterribacter sp.]